MSNQAHRQQSCWCGHSAELHRSKGYEIDASEDGIFWCEECDRRPLVDGPEMHPLPSDRRRFERFSLPTPIRTSVGSSPAYVIDASIAGLGVLHHDAAPKVGASCRLMFHSEFGAITLECEVVRTAVDRQTDSSSEKTRQSGLRIVAADFESEARLRNLVMALALSGSTGPESNNH
jgi:hypothetical protein